MSGKRRSKKGTMRVNIHNVDIEIWHKAKEFAREHKGSYYGVMGYLVSASLELFLSSTSNNSNPLPHPNRVKNFKDPKHLEKTLFYVEVASNLKDFSGLEEWELQPKMIKNNITETYERRHGTIPNRKTVDECFNYFINKGALRRTPYGVEIRSKKLEEISEFFKNRLDERGEDHEHY